MDRLTFGKIHHSYIFVETEQTTDEIKLNVVSWELNLQVFGYDKDS